MKNLFIYHPGTGTVIALSDEVYLCDMDAIDAVGYSAIENGQSVSERVHKGLRLDNYNMALHFFEE